MDNTNYKIVAVVALAGVISVPLILLEKHRQANVSQPSGAQQPGPVSSGNPAADRVHELKALEEELLKKPEHPPILFRLAQLSTRTGEERRRRRLTCGGS